MTNSITDTINNEKIISIIGLAKNTGKTVCLNQILMEFKNKQKKVGITSIGRDGEKNDALNNEIQKPAIYLSRGSIVSSARPLLEKSNLKYRVLYQTSFRSSLGIICIVELEEEGEIEVAGPATISQMKHVSTIMLKYGADYVLIDGALNRKASASPFICDGIILSTGAVLNKNPDEVIDMTKSHIEMLTIPKLINENVLYSKFPSQVKVLAFSKNIACTPLSINPLNESVEKLNYHIPEDTEYLYFKNSLVGSIIDRILKLPRKVKPSFVIKDSSCLFISNTQWTKYKKQGVKIFVMYSTNLLGITQNPVAPLDYYFDSENFLVKMAEKIPLFKIYNVLTESYQKNNDFISEDFKKNMEGVNIKNIL